MVLIYALKCKANGFAYVGSTKGKAGKRMREHRCLLNAGSHACAGLLADWRAYGEPAFSFDVLEEVPDGNLPRRREAELRWMDAFSAEQRLYNEHRISMEPAPEARELGVRNAHKEPGNRWTPEANLKRSLAQLGKPKGHGAKISATKRARRLQVMK